MHGDACGDTEAFSRATHSLKSAAALVKNASAVETFGHQNGFEDARTRMPTLEAETARLVVALERERPPQ